jgi:hypothetical protein
MTNTKLFTFGDSWPYGSDLAPDEVPYGNILAELLNSSEYENFSVPATSNEHMIIQLQNCVNKRPSIQDSTAVFFITDPARSCWIGYDQKAVDVRPDANADTQSREYLYFKYFHTPHQEKFRTHQTMLALQRMSSVLGLEDYYVVGWVPGIDFDCPGIDKNKIYKQGRVSCANMFNSLTIDCINRGCHPNQAGHRVIAENLLEWIRGVRVQSKI